MAEPIYSNAAPVSAPAGPARPLTLPHAAAVRVVGFARRGYPYEVCGLLLGRVDHDGVHVHDVSEARNLVRERKRDRYVLDPLDWLAAEKRAQAEGFEVVGVWHTHPDHPAHPSVTDLQAAWPDFSYLILSVRPAGVTDITCWRLDLPKGDGFVEQPVQEFRS